MDLHRHPELSLHEQKTAVVGVLKNGAGPEVLLRTEMDALPVEEKTGLPYTSMEPGVDHACGHDAHMAAWTTTARIMAASRNRLRGPTSFPRK